MLESAAQKTKSFIDAMPSVGEGPLALGKTIEIAGKSSNKFEFSFEYLGLLFAVKASSEGQKTHMKVHAHLGNMPYSVEGSARRNNALQILDVASLHLGGRVIVTPRKRILLIEDYVFNEPLTPVLMLTKTTTLLIQAKPFLEIMARVITPPMVHVNAAA